MNHIFTDMITEKWLKIYMDNLGIHTKDNLGLHHQQIHQVLSCLREHGLSLKISKCSFDTPTMEYLGMIIGQGLVHMDPAKLPAIKDWCPPSLVKGVRSFLGFANFYHKFIPNYSNIVMPIVLLTHTVRITPGHELPFSRRLLTPYALSSYLHPSFVSRTSLAPFLS